MKIILKHLPPEKQYLFLQSMLGTVIDPIQMPGVIRNILNEVRGEEKYLIWSFEHDAWWKPDHLGYSENVNEAGEYTFEEATKILQGANLKEYNEAMVPV